MPFSVSDEGAALHAGAGVAMHFTERKEGRTKGSAAISGKTHIVDRASYSETGAHGA